MNVEKRTIFEGDNLNILRGLDTEMGVCQDTLVCVMSGWVLPQGQSLEGLIGDSRKDFISNGSLGTGVVKNYYLPDVKHCYEIFE